MGRDRNSTCLLINTKSFRQMYTALPCPTSMDDSLCHTDTVSTAFRLEEQCCYIFRRFLAHVYYHLAENDVVFTRLYQGLKHYADSITKYLGQFIRFEHLGSPHIAVLGVVHFYLYVNRLMN